jgi:hypothetical protein
MSKISLQLKNDLAVPVSLNVLGGSADSSSQNNADTLYEWDLASEDWVNVDTVIIQSKLRGQSSFTSYSTSITNLSYEGVALALSTLNLGNFKNDRSTIYTYNSDIEFADLILTLTNIPLPSQYITDMYNHFVPVDTPLRQFVYPNLLDFQNEWEPALNLLFQQTNAAADIDTYGMRCIYPLIPNVNSQEFSSGTFSIQFFTGSPKAPALQPILSSDKGVSQGYFFSLNPSLPIMRNAILYFPSGNISESYMMQHYGAASYVFYFDPTTWSGMSNWQWMDSAVLLSTSGMLDDMPVLQGFTVSTNTNLTYPNGWTFPNINLASGNQLSSISLDNFTFFIQPTQTMTNPGDFNLGASWNGLYFPSYVIIEGYDNWRFTPTGTATLSYQANRFYILQYNGTVYLSPQMNNFWEYDGLGVNFLWNSGPTNQEIIWEDTTSGVYWNGFNSITMNGVAMTAFPPIREMNRFQNKAPFTDFQITLNLSNNKFSVTTINQILIDLANNAIAGRTNFFSSTIDLSGQTPAAPPSGAGITAANTLISNGITVITD